MVPSCQQILGVLCLQVSHQFQVLLVFQEALVLLALLFVQEDLEAQLIQVVH